MIIDAKIDWKNKKLLLIHDIGPEEALELEPAYFYVIARPRRAQILRRLFESEDVDIEEDYKIPIIYKGNRYEPDPSYSVYKVLTNSPSAVPQISRLVLESGLRVAASNVRYIVRLLFDKNVEFFNTIPLYYGFDSEAMHQVAQVTGLVFDIEVVNNKPRVVSVYQYKPFSEIRKEDVEVYLLPEDEDKLLKLFNKYNLLMGHNIIGFDIPVLRQYGLPLDTTTKSVFDTSVLLATYGNALKVGSARSLLDVATILKKDAGITDEELELKKKVHGRVDSLPLEEIIKYNVNDVVLTAKLLNIFYPFVATVAAMTSIPPSEIVSMPSGVVAEYFLLRLIELLGFVPEYRETGARLVGERVWLEAEGKTYHKVLQTDVKMMYPSFVMANYIDPTLHIGNNEFDRGAGIGILYSAVKRLAQIRALTRKLKKTNKLYEPMDAGIKSILNALAYGVQGKQSGLALMGNPWCPEKIFYGTREAQFQTIEYLRKRGYRVIYSDTDSFFIALDNCNDENQCNETIKKVVDEINSFLAKWGLEVDVEDFWDTMYIYKKKNYILRKDNVVIVKGSALNNLDKYYTPEAIRLREILSIPDKKERLHYIKEVIESTPIEELLIRGHNQLWRLIGKDVMSWKRLRDRRERYMRVLTPWPEQPALILKKARIGHMLLPHSNPIFKPLIENNGRLDLESQNPFGIIELLSLKLDGPLERLKWQFGALDLVVYLDKLYTLRPKSLFYLIRQGGGIRRIPTSYSGTYPPHPVGILEGLEGEFEIREFKPPEDVFRRLLYKYVVSVLREYNIV